MTALSWIQENISAFGGDAARVTIAGESAGAKLTDTLMGIPSAQPLFHEMISESGEAERIWNRAASADISKGFGDIWQEQSSSAIASLKTATGAGVNRSSATVHGNVATALPAAP
jgi:para-nitrobenzyl esterase